MHILFQVPTKHIPRKIISQAIKKINHSIKTSKSVKELKYARGIPQPHNGIKLEISDRWITGKISKYLETKQHTSKQYLSQLKF